MNPVLIMNMKLESGSDIQPHCSGNIGTKIIPSIHHLPHSISYDISWKHSSCPKNATLGEKDNQSKKRTSGADITFKKLTSNSKKSEMQKPNNKGPAQPKDAK